ncbi:hypothetical protein C0J52_00493 [Blattella germanica]|nr:hypothetical protein C0J52_00493 [Blattella germanica]
MPVIRVKLTRNKKIGRDRGGEKAVGDGWSPDQQDKIRGEELWWCGGSKAGEWVSLTLCVPACSRCNTMSTLVPSDFRKSWKWMFVVVVFFQLSLGAAADNSTKVTKNLFGIFASRPPPVVADTPQCTCRCGDPNDGSRIVGGKPTEVNEFPWMARLSYFNRFYCGGMLINDKYVLTAAHCVKGFMWFMIKVTFGEHDRCNSTLKPESRFVLRAITGDFSFMNFDHDIALLRLNDKVPITDTIPNVYEGTKAVAAGWGTLHEDGKPSCILQQVEVPVMSNADCKKNTKYNEKMISDNMMCAGYPDGMKDSCQGDSGGPLATLREDKKYELIGIVSWGNGCARPGYPGVYTRVTRYLDWIKENSKDGCYCQD